MRVINTENISPKQNKKRNKCKLSGTQKTFQLYLLVFTLVFAVCCLYAVFQMTNSRYVTITINSSSVSKGQNPDGSAFDIYEILSDEVLEAASEKLGSRITADELKLHLSVSDALTADTNQQLKQSILDGEYENVYFPTVYRLTYATVSDRISDAGILEQIGSRFRSFSFFEMDRVLEAVTESYREYYEKTYLTYDAMFEIDWENIDTMDYYNRAAALRTESMRILRFLEDKETAYSVSESSPGKLTYNDLSNDLWQLIRVDIENHQAYIIQNSITKSRKELLRQFRYMEEIHIEEHERKTEEYLILDEAVEMYDSSTTKVVFIPALDQDNDFYMNRTKVGLDYLVESADAARLAADEAEHNAKYYQYLQACFSEAVTPKQSQIAHTDAIYHSIKEQVEELMESVRVLLAQSNQAENEGIKVSGAAMTVGIVGVGMSLAKRFVILSMAAYVLICIPSFFFKKKGADTQEV
jgi:hypothetical protein